MKLLKIKISKDKKNTTVSLVKEIIAKYPDADVDSIYATLLSNGVETTFGSIRSAKSEFTRMGKIKEMLRRK